MKLALLGTTALLASGDSGVSTEPGVYNNSNGCLGPNDEIFSPSSMDDCPYILTIGATTIRANVSGYSSNPEMAVFAGHGDYPYTSGGGFSNIFRRPSYQHDAVQTYFDEFDPGFPHYSTTKGKNIGANGGIYNRIGRGYPDVSANGAWWNTYAGGKLHRFGGTSMSTPLVASIINLVRDFSVVLVCQNPHPSSSKLTHSSASSMMPASMPASQQSASYTRPSTSIQRLSTTSRLVTIRAAGKPSLSMPRLVGIRSRASARPTLQNSRRSLCHCRRWSCRACSQW